VVVMYAVVVIKVPLHCSCWQLPNASIVPRTACLTMAALPLILLH